MSFQYGYLTGTIRAIIGDTDGDGDHFPDIVHIDGLKAEVVPSPSRLTDSTAKITYFAKPIALGFDNEGVLRLLHHIDGDGDPMPDAVREIPLIAQDNDDINPSGGWTYRITITAPGIPTWSFPFQVNTGEVHDLSEIAPIEQSSGVITTRGPEGRGIASIADPDASGTAVVTYTDGTVDELPLPPGPPGLPGGSGGSDAATAALIESGPETRAAVNGLISDQTIGLGVTYRDAGSVSVSVAIDADAASVHSVTLVGDTDITITGGEDGQALAILLNQDGSGAHEARFSGVRWPTPPPAFPTEAFSSVTITMLRVSGMWYVSSSADVYLRGALLSGALLSDTFTAPDGTLLTEHAPDIGPDWVRDAKNLTNISPDALPAPLVRGNRASAPEAKAAAAVANIGQPTAVITADFDVSGTGTNDRANIALGSSSNDGFVASLRANRAVVFRDGNEVYSNLDTYTTGTVEVGYDGTQAWCKINSVEVWRAPAPGRSGTLVGVGFGYGTVRYLDNVVVVDP